MKKYIGITLIVLLGLFLRLLFINKPDGLWNDEYISWMIAATPFSNGFFNAVKSQCHMPFYYLYLKCFMQVFGQSDLALRISSTFTGVLAIIAMYLVGKEKDEKNGILCAFISAISSFLIYYSQEVRLYSVLFLFSAITLIYTLRILKEASAKNIILFCIFNFLIIFTHTIGFVFVFFNIIFVSLSLYKSYKKIIIYIWSAILTSVIVSTPLILKIFSTKSFSQWWGHFSISKIGFLFTDYFSPVITNLTNAPDNFFYMPKLALFMIIPAIVAIACIIIAIIKEKRNLGLFLIAVSTIIVLVIAAITGKLVFITKYSIEIYPILIFLVCSGLTSIKNNIVRNSLIVIYSLISIGYIILAPYSAPKMRRPEGHKIVTDMLQKADLKKDDIILLEYYPADRFKKYFNFNNYRVIEIHKGNFPAYLTNEKSYINVLKNGKNIYKDMFLHDNNQYFENILKNNIYDQLKPGQSLAIVILNSVAFYSPKDIKNITSDDTRYKKEPLLFLIFSYIKNKTFIDTMQTLAISRFEQKGNWIVIKFTKVNNSNKN